MGYSVNTNGFSLYLETHPDQTALPEAFYQLAGGQFEEAYNQFRAWLESHPEDEWAYEGAIACLLQQNRWEDAQSLTLEGLEKVSHSQVLRARASWIIVYQAREREAYHLVKRLLEEGFSNRLWLEEVVLPLRNHLVCLLSDKRFATPKNLSRKAFRRQLNQQIAFLEHWLEKHRVPLPDEPVGTRISLTMIVRNESVFLAECLQSVEGVVDEIVVVDTGSTDDTVAIAERFGAKVVHFEWQNDFAQARNVALQHATGDWVLVLDADERLLPESRAKILEAVRHPQFMGYYMEILSDIDSNLFIHRLVRLFRRLSYAHWEGAIHEQIMNSLTTRGGAIATLTGAQILHLGYQKQVVQDRSKVERNLHLLEQELAKNPDDPFHWFNLGNTYYSTGDDARAEYYLKGACERLRGTEDYASFCWSLYIHTLRAQKRYEEALATADQAKQVCPSAQVYYAEAHTLLDTGDYERVVELLRQAREDAIQRGWLQPNGMSLNPSANFTGDAGILTHKWRAMMVEALDRLERYDEIHALFSEGQGTPEEPFIRFQYAQWLLHHGSYEAADRWLQFVEQVPDLRVSALQLRARLWWDVGDYARALPLFRALHEMEPTNEAYWQRCYDCAERTQNHAEIAGVFERLERAGYSLSADMYINWGRALWQIKDYEHAIEKFACAIQKDPNNANAFFNAGDALYQLGAYMEAADAYSAGLERDPMNAQAWFTLGNCYFRLGVYDAAQIAFEQTLNFDPTHQPAQHNLELTRERIKITAA